MYKINQVKLIKHNYKCNSILINHQNALKTGTIKRVKIVLSFLKRIEICELIF